MFWWITLTIVWKALVLPLYLLHIAVSIQEKNDLLYAMSHYLAVTYFVYLQTSHFKLFKSLSILH